MSEFPRITIVPDQMGGVPCIRGMRMPVATVVRMVANGLSVEEILDLHPNLESADITEALRYAAELAERPVVRRAETALSILERAQRNSTLCEEDADRQAVAATRALRAVVSRGKR